MTAGEPEVTVVIHPQRDPRSTHNLPEYEFNDTPHLTTTPSSTESDTMLQVGIIRPAANLW